MEISKIIISIMIFLLSTLSFYISYRQVKGKGFVFNNSFIYASKEERNKIDKKPEYKQSKIVFIFIGLIFLTMTFQVVSGFDLFYLIEALLILAVIFYAIISTVNKSRNIKRS